MDLKELQELVKQENGKLIIIEDGEPTMVILPYGEYKKKPKVSVPFPEEPQSSDDELTIDDLPL